MSEQQNNGVVAQLPTPESVDVRSFAAFAAIGGVGLTPFATSLNPEIPAEAMLIFKAKEEADVKLDDHIGKRINVVNVFMTRASKEKPGTGEVEEFPRTVLIDDKGVTYESYSNGIYDSVMTMIGCFKSPPWKMGIEVTVREKRTGNGHKRHSLIPSLIATPKEAKK